MEKSKLFSTPVSLKTLRRLVHQAYAGQEDQPTLMKVFMDMTGDMAAAVMLESAVDWSYRCRKRDGGWWYKSKESWRTQVGLSKHQVIRCEEILSYVGLTMEIRRSDHAPAKVSHYRLRWPLFWVKFAMVLKVSAEQLTKFYVLSFSTDDRAESQQMTGEIPHTYPARNSPDNWQESGQTITTVESTEKSTDETSVEAAGVTRARARDGVPTAASYDLPDTQKKLHVPSGHPGPGMNYRPERLEDDPLWQAFARAWGDISPVVPAPVRSAYCESRDRLVLMRASPEEIEALTRHKIKVKREQLSVGKVVAPYRFTYLADDLPEWRRQGQVSSVRSYEGWKRYVSENPYINSGLRDLEDTPVN